MLDFGIPASITLAQGMLESGDGNSKLAMKAKNHFGVKCQGEWEGETYHQDDDSKNECFRKYKNPEQSYKDHSQFLKNRQHYASLFNLDITDYKGWAKGLKKAGYATNPKYPELIIKLIEDWKLYEYDKLKKIPKDWGSVSGSEPVSDNKGNAGAKPTSQLKTGLINEVETITLKSGDTWESIAKAKELRLWQIYRYNEFDKTKKPEAGETIYLHPKRRKSKVGCHTVSKGETVWSVSQKYGVKMKYIRKRNGIDENDKISSGQKLLLKRNGCK